MDSLSQPSTDTIMQMSVQHPSSSYLAPPAPPSPASFLHQHSHSHPHAFASSPSSSSTGQQLQHASNWKSQIISQVQQRNQKEVSCFVDIFTAYSRMLLNTRALKARVFQLEQEIMTTRQLSSLTATPTVYRGPDYSGAGSHGTSTSGGSTTGGGGGTGGGGLSVAAQKMYEEKILKLQEDLTSAFRMQSENSATFLRLKEQAEKDEKALLRKEEELAEKTRLVINLQQSLAQEKENSINRNKNLEQTCELLRGEVQGSRLLLKNQESKINSLASENDTLLTTILRLKEEQSHEQNELNVVRQELLKANAEAKLATEKTKILEENSKSIAPAEVDMSDMNSLLDHVNWTKNVMVQIPNDRKRTIRGHRGPCSAIRYNTAGTLVASGGTDGLVKVYDARTGANRASLRGTKDSVMNVAFSTDDNYLLASGNDSIARMWSLKSAKVIHTFVGHQAKVWAESFTADGTQVITGSHDRTLKIWDVVEGACKKSISCHSSCNYLSLSRNDDILATAHLDTHVRFWSLKSGELMHELEDVHNGQATSVEFSHDSSYIVTCSRDNTVKITDIRTYKTLKIFEGTSRSPFRNLINWNRAVFSPDDKHVIAGGHMGEIFFWNMDTGRVEAILPGVNINEGIYGAATPTAAGGSSSSQPVVAGGSSLAAVAAANAISEQALNCVDWNRNGRQVMSCDQGGNIHVWEYDAAAVPLHK